MRKNDFRSEYDYILPVLRCCENKGGQALFSDIRPFIEETVRLTSKDQQEYESGIIRYTQIIRNLKCNKTLDRMGLAISIPQGFQLTSEGLKYLQMHS